MSTVKPVGKLFPNLTRAIASYDPATQTVIFEEISNARRQELFSRSPQIGDEHDLSVLAHEYRHCLDHLCTLWGQQHLLKLQKALTAVLSASQHPPDVYIDEANYIFDYKDEEGKSFQRDISNSAFAAAADIAKSASIFWVNVAVSKIQKPRERINNGDLIFKVNFYAEKEKYLVVSLPLNVITLLELNALAEEELVTILSYTSVYEKGELGLQYLINSPDRNRGVFNYEMAVYNVAIQAARSVLHMDSWTESVTISSKIATLALNLPSSLIKNILFREDNDLPVAREIAQKLLDDHDYGFVFFMLCRNYSVVYKAGNLESFDLDELLASNNLPNKENLLNILNEEFQSILSENTKLRFKEWFINYNRIGTHVLNKYGLDGGILDVFLKFNSAGWSPPYAHIDGGITENEEWVKQIAQEENNSRNYNFWYSTIKFLDDNMDYLYSNFTRINK